MAVYVPDGARTWWTYYRVEGRRHRKNTLVAVVGDPGSPDYEASRHTAQQIEDRWREAHEAQAAEARKDAEARRRLGIGDVKVPTLRDAAQAYWDARGHAVANKDADARNLDRIMEIVGGHRLVTEIGDHDVRLLVAKRAAEPLLTKPRRCRQTGAMLPGVPQVYDIDGELRPYVEREDKPSDIVKVKPSTVNRQTVDLLRRVMEYARSALKVPGMQTIDYGDARLKEPSSRDRVLSYEEEARVYPHLRVGYGAAFRFALASALRLKNFTDLKWRDVNMSTGELTVIQKGNQRHTVRITPEIKAILDDQRGRDPVHVFVYVYEATPTPWKNPRNGQVYEPGKVYPVTYWGFSSWWKRVREAANIPDVTIHDLRRTAVTRVIDIVGDVKVAQELAGHGSAHLTQAVYNKLSKSRVREKLDDAERRIAEQRAQALARVDAGKLDGSGQNSAKIAKKRSKSLKNNAV